MLVHTDLPESASLLQKLCYPFIRTFFYYFFGYLPYAPIKRINKPEIKGNYLWASSHSNYLCDTIPAGSEGARPTKFLAKSTLFRFPIKGFIEFCGALPVARAEDFKPGESRSGQNRSTFKVAIQAMKEGWPVAVFPEGVSIVAPGLVLPLKPGVAKLGFAAEEANDFSLGLKIIPVGLEYGSRSRVGSGLTIRYGRPLFLKDYKDLYHQKKDEGVKKIMEDLTHEMIHIYPHFRNETEQTLGRKLVTLGLARSKYAVAQLFLQKEKDPTFWAGLEQRIRAFEEANKGRRIPVPAWGHRRAWKELGPKRRRQRLLFIFLGLPLAIVDVVNNSFAEFCLRSLVDQVAVDETEKMSLRFILSIPVLSVLYGLQFWFLKDVVFEESLAAAGWKEYLVYAFGSFAIWYFGVHWRRQFKRIVSLYFFRRAGVDGRSEAVFHYRALRQYLSDLKNYR